MTDDAHPVVLANTPTAAAIMVKREDFPGLHRGSDEASSKAQRTYLILQRLYLGSLVIGSAFGALTAIGLQDWNVVIYTVTASVFAVGLLLLGVIRTRQDDKAWFDGRAIAESVKTATWRFMAKAPPFAADSGDPERRFVAELAEIRKARPNFGKHLAGVLDANATAITDVMRRTREMTLKERKQLYIASRLRDQKAWYAKKAQANARSGNIWFAATAVLQTCALVTAVVQAKLGGLPVNILPLLATFTAVVAAWSQVKRYDELAQAYALAAHELEELDSLGTSVKTEAEFAQLVEQTEEACSREHTMWAARRDTRLPGSTNVGKRMS